MQKSKGLIILSFVSVVIITALVLLLVFIQNIGKNSVIPISYIKNDPNVIRIVSKELEKFTYATVSPEDTIVLKDLSGEERIINLERKNWNNIKWSPDGTLISVKGTSEEGKENLFIFNMATEKWSQVTNFSDYKIENYTWVSNDELVFIQGVEPDKWLHTYSYTANGQAIKVNRVSGEFIKTNNIGNILIFKESDDSFTLRDINGESIINTKDLTLSKTSSDDLKVIKDVESLAIPSEVAIVNDKGEFFIYDIVDKILTKFEDSKLGNKFICATENSFKTFAVDDNKLIAYFADKAKLKLDFVNTVINVNQDSMLSLVKCSNTNYLIKEVSGEIKWFDNSEFPELIILEGDLDVDVK